MASTTTQWRVVQAIPLIPVGAAFIGSFFLTDTPRWLASKDRVEEALEALSKLRQSDKADQTLSIEYQEIREEIMLRQQDLRGVGIVTIIKEILTTSTYRKRFLLGITMQTVAQWSGGNGITYYIPTVRLLHSLSLPTLTNQTLDFHVCWRNRSEPIPYYLRCLRNRQACFHAGFRLGSD
jgi:hypothetical protein